MTNQLSEEQMRKLLPALSPLAESIGKGSTPDQSAIKEILHDSGVDIVEWAIEELEVCSNILLHAPNVSNDDEENDIVAKLKDRGIPEASAQLSVALARGELASVEPPEDALSPSSPSSGVTGDVVPTITSSTLGEPPPSSTHRPAVPSPIGLAKPRSLEQDIQFEIERQNFVRAAMLAQRSQYPQDEIRRLQELALKKYVFEYRNYPGFWKLVQEYEFSEADLDRILGKDVKEILKLK